MSADYTLTPEEQREIRLYITDSINGANINPDKLPRWLAELIKAKSERDALKADADRLNAALESVFTYGIINSVKIRREVEAALAAHHNGK